MRSRACNAEIFCSF
ncbi:hypothetical protein TSOC_010705 [Tetrabaena socialis]|uniref:Uncharacterized protein n=1 Tax=Tetrabaena socialis TaxID=47790 RepID=A0A2J7ZSJ9_9CHLO|nr:hypothetical protein TSOC_010705 [Tetrabaena socialis]|eukprot:PNH03252.1 hypothetical protein TSOC_010705 [Tetrabaena socialis]